MCETNQWPPEGSISNLPPFIWVRYHSSLKTFCRLTKCSNPEPCACLMINEDFTLQIDEFFSIQERKSIIQDYFPSKAFYWFTTLLKIWTEIHFRDFRFIKESWLITDKFREMMCKIFFVWKIPIYEKKWKEIVLKRFQ